MLRPGPYLFSSLHPTSDGRTHLCRSPFSHTFCFCADAVRRHCVIRTLPAALFPTSVLRTAPPTSSSSITPYRLCRLPFLYGPRVYSLRPSDTFPCSTRVTLIHPRRLARSPVHQGRARERGERGLCSAVPVFFLGTRPYISFHIATGESSQSLSAVPAVRLVPSSCTSLSTWMRTVDRSSSMRR